MSTASSNTSCFACFVGGGRVDGRRATPVTTVRLIGGEPRPSSVGPGRRWTTVPWVARRRRHRAGSPVSSSVRIGYRPGRSNLSRSSTLLSTSVGTSSVSVAVPSSATHDRRAGVRDLHAVDRHRSERVAIDVAADEVVDVGRPEPWRGQRRVVRHLDGEGDQGRGRHGGRRTVSAVVVPVTRPAGRSGSAGDRWSSGMRRWSATVGFGDRGRVAAGSE